MKNILKHTNTFSLALLALGLTLGSCESFLDQDPQDSVTEAIYYKTADQFEYASNFFYKRLEFEDGDDSSCDLSNNLSDSDLYGQGLTTTPASDEIWEDNYKHMRAVNQLIEKAAEYDGDQADIKEYVGTAYFFRAWHHWKLLQRFGGVPIVTRSLDVSYEEVYAPRNSRYEVVAQILRDLNQIIDDNMLRSHVNIGDDELGKLSLEAVQAFKARILLYEATWETYVGTTTDGDGENVGAGSEKPSGYPSVEEMLTEAKAEALSVMNCGAFELWNKSAELEAAYEGAGERHLYYLFCLEDGGGNPGGFTKADNKEFIFQTIYDFSFRQINQNLSHSKKYGPSRKLMDMYLCSDGLPVQYSSVFEGYNNMIDEFNNRDQRLTSLVAKPFQSYWGWGSGNSGGGADYTIPIADLDPVTYAFVPDLSGDASLRNFGYQGRKFVSEHAQRETRNESFNYPLIRLAELMLIYAEATCELGGGTISDADLDLSINKLRARAGVAPLTNALIAPYADLTMIGEIRRERGIELYGENFRFDDLKRWGIAEEELNRNVCVTYVEYDGAETEYSTAVSPKDGSDIYVPSGFGYGLTTEAESPSSYAGIAATQAGAVIIDTKSNRNFRRMNYLEPLPSSEMALNPALLQNPDWN